MKVAILKYNAGNIYSVQLALRRLGVKALVSDQPEVLEKAEKIIFPGVGHAGSAMRFLRERQLDVWLRQTALSVLGICLGMQLMCKHSSEGDTAGMEIFSAEVRRYSPTLKVPHMGWNQIFGLAGPLFQNVAEGSFVYFVHSYFAGITPETVATCQYGRPFSAALQKENFFGVQFHPEKSGRVGEQILKNFLEKC